MSKLCFFVEILDNFVSLVLERDKGPKPDPVSCPAV